MAKKRDSQSDPVVDELISIKRLLILGLLRGGATQSQVAAALGVSQSVVSKMFPKGVGVAIRTVRK